FRTRIITDALGFWYAAKDAFHLFGIRSQSRDIVAGNPYGNRETADAPQLELAYIDARARNRFGQLVLQDRNKVACIVFVIYLNDDLRIVELLEFRRNREPESWPAATDKCGQRLQNALLSAFFAMVFFAVFLDRMAYDCLDLRRSFDGCGQRSVLRHPHIDVRQVGKVLRKVLCLELAHYEAAECKDRGGSREYLPAMGYRKMAHSVVESSEPLFSPFFDSRLRFRLQQVVPQQRDEGHRHQP